MPGGIVELVVDADHDVERRFVLDGSRDDHAFDAAIEVGLKLIRLQEFTCAFQHDVATEIAPGDLAGISLFAEADAMAVDHNRFSVFDADRRIPPPVKAIEFEKMRRRRDAALELVDVNDIQAVARAGVRFPGDGCRRIAARNASRPMRPMPLMPTLITIVPVRVIRGPCRRSHPDAL